MFHRAVGKFTNYNIVISSENSPRYYVVSPYEPRRDMKLAWVYIYLLRGVNLILL